MRESACTRVLEPNRPDRMVQVNTRTHTPGQVSYYHVCVKGHANNLYTSPVAKSSELLPMARKWSVVMLSAVANVETTTTTTTRNSNSIQMKKKRRSKFRVFLALFCSLLSNESCIYMLLTPVPLVGWKRQRRRRFHPQIEMDFTININKLPTLN